MARWANPQTGGLCRIVTCPVLKVTHYLISTLRMTSLHGSLDLVFRYVTESGASLVCFAESCNSFLEDSARVQSLIFEFG